MHHFVAITVIFAFLMQIYFSWHESRLCYNKKFYKHISNLTFQVTNKNLWTWKWIFRFGAIWMVWKVGIRFDLYIILKYFSQFSIIFLFFIVNKYNNEVAFARGILMYICMLKRSFYHVMQFESAYFREQKNFTCMLVSFQWILVLSASASICINTFLSLNFLSSFA